MNVDRTKKFHIPLEFNGQKYHITVQIENPGSDDTVYMATGQDYIDPMESPIGFGNTVDEAVIAFLEDYGKPRQFTEYTQEFPNYPQ